MYADVATLIKAYMKSEKVSSVPAFARKLRIPEKDIYVALGTGTEKRVTQRLVDALAMRYGGDFSFLLNEYKASRPN